MSPTTKNMPAPPIKGKKNMKVSVDELDELLDVRHEKGRVFFWAIQAKNKLSEWRDYDNFHGAREHRLIKKFIAVKENLENLNKMQAEKKAYLKKKSGVEKLVYFKEDEKKCGMLGEDDEERQYKYKAILDIRHEDGVIQFSTEWENEEGTSYSPSWEPLDSFDGGFEEPMIKQFLKDPPNRKKLEEAQKEQKEYEKEHEKDEEDEAAQHAMEPNPAGNSISVPIIGIDEVRHIDGKVYFLARMNSDRMEWKEVHSFDNNYNNIFIKEFREAHLDVYKEALREGKLHRSKIARRIKKAAERIVASGSSNAVEEGVQSSNLDQKARRNGKKSGDKTIGGAANQQGVMNYEGLTIPNSEENYYYIKNVRDIQLIRERKELLFYAQWDNPYDDYSMDWVKVEDMGKGLNNFFVREFAKKNKEKYRNVITAWKNMNKTAGEADTAYNPHGKNGTSSSARKSTRRSAPMAHDSDNEEEEEENEDDEGRGRVDEVAAEEEEGNGEDGEEVETDEEHEDEEIEVEEAGEGGEEEENERQPDPNHLDDFDYNRARSPDMGMGADPETRMGSRTSSPDMEMDADGEVDTESRGQSPDMRMDADPEIRMGSRSSSPNMGMDADGEAEIESRVQSPDMGMGADSKTQMGSRSSSPNMGMNADNEVDTESRGQSPDMRMDADPEIRMGSRSSSPNMGMDADGEVEIESRVQSPDMGMGADPEARMETCSPSLDMEEDADSDLQMEKRSPSLNMAVDSDGEAPVEEEQSSSSTSPHSNPQQEVADKSLTGHHSAVNLAAQNKTGHPVTSPTFSSNAHSSTSSTLEAGVSQVSMLTVTSPATDPSPVDAEATVKKTPTDKKSVQKRKLDTSEAESQNKSNRNPGAPASMSQMPSTIPLGPQPSTPSSLLDALVKQQLTLANKKQSSTSLTQEAAKKQQDDVSDHFESISSSPSSSEPPAKKASVKKNEPHLHKSAQKRLPTTSTSSPENSASEYRRSNSPRSSVPPDPVRNRSSILDVVGSSANTRATSGSPPPTQENDHPKKRELINKVKKAKVGIDFSKTDMFKERYSIPYFEIHKEFFDQCPESDRLLLPTVYFNLLQTVELETLRQESSDANKTESSKATVESTASPSLPPPVSQEPSTSDTPQHSEQYQTSSSSCLDDPLDQLEHELSKKKLEVYFEKEFMDIKNQMNKAIFEDKNGAHLLELIRNGMEVDPIWESGRRLMDLVLEREYFNCFELMVQRGYDVDSFSPRHDLPHLYQFTKDSCRYTLEASFVEARKKATGGSCVQMEVVRAMRIRSFPSVWRGRKNAVIRSMNIHDAFDGDNIKNLKTNEVRGFFVFSARFKPASGEKRDSFEIEEALPDKMQIIFNKCEVYRTPLHLNLFWATEPKGNDEIVFSYPTVFEKRDDRFLVFQPVVVRLNTYSLPPFSKNG